MMRWLPIVFASLPAWPVIAWGQGSQDGGALEEVVVSAEKRTQSLQDVPLSITAITAQTLENAGIQSFNDYAAKVPNLSFGYGQGQGVLESRAISIRGIQGEDTTGFYIDDLPLPTTLDPRVIDLERIEVLRGPQGTLYGARSMGGTVKLITTPPDPTQFSGKVHALGSTIDGGGNGYQVDGTVNVPIFRDRAALRLTAFSGTDGGFINRVFPDAQDPSRLDEVKHVARLHYQGVLASMKWAVTDQLTIRPLFLYQSSNLNGLPEADRTSDTLTEMRLFDIAEGARDRWAYSGVSITYVTPIGEITSATSFFDRRAHEVEDTSEFTSFAFGTAPLPATIVTTNTRHSFVQELRFASAFRGPVQFVGGLYFSRSNLTFYNVQDTAGLNAASGNTLGTNVVYNGYSRLPSKESAAFGELTYTVNPQWSATFGLRYSRAENAFHEKQFGIVVGDGSDSSGDSSEHGVTPKVAVKYEPNEHVSYYALAAKGFRLGGPQTPPPESFCAADYAAAGLTPASLQSFRSDKLWNYEIGSKTSFLDRRLSINGALFWIDWSDLQQTLRLACGFSSRINSGKARSRGAELELSAIPIEHLTLTVAAGYTDAKIVESGALVRLPANQPIQQVAPWTGSVSGQYAYPLGGGFQGLVRADYSYTDRSFSANNDPTHLRLRKAYDQLNLRLGVMKDAWEVNAFVNNATNVHPNLGDTQSEAAELPGRPRIFTSAPRTYGLETRVNF